MIVIPIKIFVVLLAFMCSNVEPYSSGAPRGACYSMKPGHSGYAQGAPTVPTSCSVSSSKTFLIWFE